MEKYFDQIVNTTVKLVQFDSSMQPAEEGYPFGKGAGECLEYFLAIAKEMGFETRNYDNYIGEVLFGEGNEFAILAHLDVMPAGSGWTYPPFGGVINDDPSAGGVLGKKIWGRGTMDDKAPAVVCLYALKALKEEGILPKRKFKLIVGCNEESGWRCIDHYNKVATLPEEGFTPDADFPVIYAEKGILQFTAHFPVETPPFTALSGGERVNMVCDEVSAILTRKGAEGLVDYANPVEGTRLSYDNTTNILHCFGKSAHGSQPQNGANALEALLYFLSTENEDCKRAYDCLFADRAGLKELQDETGYLTMSPNVATFKEGILSISTDIRYPSTYPLEKITERLDEWGVAYKIDRHKAPLYSDPQGKLIQTLLGVYERATGEKCVPIAIGGGTYARALKCGCGFGPQLKTQEATVHQPNEYVTFDMLRLMSKVYYEAIKALALNGEPPVEEIMTYTDGESDPEPESVETPASEVPALPEKQTVKTKIGKATLTFKEKQDEEEPRQTVKLGSIVVDFENCDEKKGCAFSVNLKIKK